MPRKWKTNPDSVDQGASSIPRDQIIKIANVGTGVDDSRNARAFSR